MRVAVWREVKRLGAVPVQHSVYALPDTSESRRGVKRVLERQEADIKVFYARPFDESMARQLVDKGLGERGEEYREIIEKCEDFIKDLMAEFEAENFTFEELEENEADYEKLVRWYDQAKKRDWFDSPRKEEVEESLEECKSLLDRFSLTVHERIVEQPE